MPAAKQRFHNPDRRPLYKGLVNRLKKISALIKYEVIDIFRGKLIWIIFFLYLFGVIQVISSMKMGGYSFFTLVGLIKVSWLPLNFIMIPVMLLSMKIGESENEIFKILDKQFFPFKDVK